MGGRSLSARERRLIALLILAALIAVVALGIVTPVLDSFSQRAERREALRTQSLLNQRLIASVPRLRRAAEASDQAIADYAVIGADRTAAAEALQDRVSQAVELAGGDIRSVEDASDDDHVRTRMIAVLTLPQMMTVIARLQDAKPHATIDGLSVTADQALISNRPDVMDVTLDVAIPWLARRG